MKTYIPPNNNAGTISCLNFEKHVFTPPLTFFEDSTQSLTQKRTSVIVTVMSML